MARVEFSKKVKDQAYARASGKCENRMCGLPLIVGHFHYDHILPCALGGKATLSNCQVLCEACHTAKTSKEDVPRIRKADRQRAKHIGASVRTGPPLKSAGFAPAPEQRKASKPLSKSLPDRRPIYE